MAREEFKHLKPARPLPRMTFAPSEPVRLAIPGLNIDASVQHVGKTKTGEMQAPSSRSTIGWYSYGFLPGTLGNAVFDGHSWHTEGKGIFADLSKLKPGDEIIVTTKTKRLHFGITGSQTYSRSTRDAAAIFGPSETAQIRLITCAGDWDEALQQYAERLVVTAAYTRED